MSERPGSNGPGPKPLNYSTPPASTSSPLLVALAWLVVGVPAAWGVTQTFKTSLKLFQSPTQASVLTSATAPAVAPRAK